MDKVWVTLVVKKVPDPDTLGNLSLPSTPPVLLLAHPEGEDRGSRVQCRGLLCRNPHLHVPP